MSTPRKLFLVWQNKTTCVGENEKTAFPIPQPVKEALVIARSVIGKLISFAAVDLLVQSSWAELDTAPQPLSHCLLIACDFFGSRSVSVRFLALWEFQPWSSRRTDKLCVPPPCCPVSCLPVIYRFWMQHSSGEDYPFILCFQAQNRNSPVTPSPLSHTLDLSYVLHWLALYENVIL